MRHIHRLRKLPLLLACLFLYAACQRAPADRPPEKPPGTEARQQTQAPDDPKGACANQAVCTKLGRCSDINGVCQALRDEDCANSENCRRYGECAVVNGACLPAADSHCENSNICKVHGQCSHIKYQCGGRGPAGKEMCMRDICVVTSEASCEESERCKSHGECRALTLDRAHSRDIDGQIMWPLLVCGVSAKSDEECTQPHGSLGKSPCSNRGQCSVSPEGICEACGDSCRESRVCKELGLCHAVSGRCHYLNKSENGKAFPCSKLQLKP